MITESIYRSTGITRITGLEVKQFANGGLIFEPHEYVGKEPDTKFTVRQIKKIAEKLRIPLNVAFYGCSDEENDLEYFLKTIKETSLMPTKSMNM